VVVNVTKFVEMHKDSKLRGIINECELINVDGMPIVWASRLLGRPLPERVTGIDLFQNLVRLCAEKGYRPYFFEARDGLVKKVVENFVERYQTLDVAGYRNGYFS